MDVIKNICRICLCAIPDNRCANFVNSPTPLEIEEFERVKVKLQVLFSQSVSIPTYNCCCRTEEIVKHANSAI